MYLQFQDSTPSLRLSITISTAGRILATPAIGSILATPVQDETLQHALEAMSFMHHQETLQHTIVSEDLISACGRREGERGVVS